MGRRMYQVKKPEKEKESPAIVKHHADKSKVRGTFTYRSDPVPKNVPPSYQAISPLRSSPLLAVAKAANDIAEPESNSYMVGDGMVTVGALGGGAEHPRYARASAACTKPNP